MIVSNGWNTDYGKLKFNIDLDEGDLFTLLDEHGIEPGAKLTVNEKFGILNNEGLAFAKFQLARVEPDMKDQLLREVERHKEARDLLLRRVADRVKKDG